MKECIENWLKKTERAVEVQMYKRQSMSIVIMPNAHFCEITITKLWKQLKDDVLCGTINNVYFRKVYFRPSVLTVFKGKTM